MLIDFELPISLLVFSEGISPLLILEDLILTVFRFFDSYMPGCINCTGKLLARTSFPFPFWNFILRATLPSHFSTTSPNGNTIQGTHIVREERTVLLPPLHRLNKFQVKLY
jgi:hypothetical protein